MADYARILSEALRDPSEVEWNGPPRSVAALLGQSDPVVVSVAVGASDGSERRVDASVTANGREWSIPFFVPDEANTVTRAWVYERPEPFDGGGLVVVLDGPSGVGKSTLMNALLDETSDPWFVFDEPHVGRIPTEHMVWRDVEPGLHRAGFIAMRALAQNGYPVVTSTGGFSAAAINDALDGVPVVRVRLRCNEPERVRRIDTEPHKRPIRTREASVEDADPGWSYDLELRTDQAAPRDLARQVLDLVAATVAEPQGRRPAAVDDHD